MNIGIILLAAGSSSRMGQPKQLLLIDGEALLIKSAKAAILSRANKVVVVLGSNYQMHKQIIKDLPLEIIENTEWTKGMGNSLKKGLTFLMDQQTKLDGVIVSVCDQPFLSTININNLIDRYEQTRSLIIASHYGNIKGVPALFDTSLFEHVLQLNDQQGAKKIIEQHQSNIDTVEFPKGIIDLDFPEDYRRLILK